MKSIVDLKPVREVEPGWYKLRWVPIKHHWPNQGTWNFVWYYNTAFQLEPGVYFQDGGRS